MSYFRFCKSQFLLSTYRGRPRCYSHSDIHACACVIVVGYISFYYTGRYRRGRTKLNCAARSTLVPTGTPYRLIIQTPRSFHPLIVYTDMPTELVAKAAPIDRQTHQIHFALVPTGTPFRYTLGLARSNIRSLLYLSTASIVVVGSFVMMRDAPAPLSVMYFVRKTENGSLADCCHPRNPHFVSLFKFSSIRVLL